MITLLQGDCLDVLPTLEAGSIDTVILDPPAGISFMGKEWDSDKGSSEQWIAWLSARLKAALRVAKPGAMLLCWALPRTSHWTGTAIERAGWEIRDTIYHVFGTGFPKSHAIGKAIDRARDDYPAIRRVVAFIRRAAVISGYNAESINSALNWGSAVADHFLALSASNASCPKWDQWLQLKALLSFDDEMDAEVWRLNGRKGQPGDAWFDREVVGHVTKGSSPLPNNHNGSWCDGQEDGTFDITAPATPDAATWDGYGTALKPAVECWWLAMKPLDGTFAANALEWGVAGLNIDGARVETAGADKAKHLAEWDRTQSKAAEEGRNSMNGGLMAVDLRPFAKEGRWPANLLLSHSPECRRVGVRKVGKGDRTRRTTPANRAETYSGYDMCSGEVDAPNTYGTETVEAWDCVDGCPIKEMDAQSGVLKSGARNGVHIPNWHDGDGPRYKGNDTGNHFASSTGGASRFFYHPKASRRERWFYCPDCDDAFRMAEREDHQHGHTDYKHLFSHPTQKPLGLMRYLVKLTRTPTGGVVLDAFMGSGTTIEACVLEGRDGIGIELEYPSYVIAQRSIEQAQAEMVQLTL